MKVILQKDIRGLGRAHEIKDVADGYALNFLLPHKYAVAATPEKLKEVEAGRAAREAAEQKEEAALVSKLDSLNGKSVTVSARATEKGGLFKAITAADIAKAIRSEQSLEILESAIELPAPVKTVGEHKAILSSKTKKAELLVVVAAVK
ncbi:MAG: ribosomal protein [Candidatus Adlerbacteria bacterium]|nr:ribosomal protein [Candidatus Adlerbacteria bacterium]